jgi:predicted transcriptional regulator
MGQPSSLLPLLLRTGGYISTVSNGGFAIMSGMTKLSEQAIAKIRELSADAFAVALISTTGEERPIMHLDEGTRAAVRDGLAQAKRGEFVPEKEMEALFKQHGL